MPTSQEALDAMTTWVAAIADNVKNPIAGISAALDHIESRLDDAALVAAMLQRIRVRLAALNEYVSELSDFGQPAVIKPVVTPLGTLLTEAVLGADVPPTCVDIAGAGELVVQVDRGKLILVLKAVLRNAFEAIDSARPPRLSVSVSQRGPSVIAIAIEDNGPGLAPEAALRATEPFYSTKEAGTGLGLSVVRKYVEAHGGALSLGRSAALGGCRVELLLPRPTRATGEIR